MSDSPTWSESTPDASTELPLWKAAIAWCDPALVQELLDAHAAYQSASTRTPRASPFPTHQDKVVVRFIALGKGGPQLDLSRRRDAVVAKIEGDLRQRIMAQQVVLLGLKVEPELDPSRTALSCWWADHLVFDWEHGTVVVHGARYVGVTGLAIQPHTSPPDRADALEQPERARSAPRRRAGRATYKSMVESALAAYLKETQKSLEAFAVAKPNQLQLARMLEARLKKFHPDKAAVKGGLPKKETIRKHARDILASGLVDKGGR